MWKSNLQAIALRSTIGLFGLVSCAPASAHMPQDTNVLDLRVPGLKEVPRASSPPAVLKGVVDYMVRPPAPPSVFDSVAAVRSVVGSGNACAPLPQGQLQQARDRGCVSPDSYLCAPIQGAAADSVCQVEMNERNALPLVGGSSWLIAGDKVWGPFGGVNQVALHHAFAANGRLYVMFDSYKLKGCTHPKECPTAEHFLDLVVLEREPHLVAELPFLYESKDRGLYKDDYAYLIDLKRNSISLTVSSVQLLPKGHPPIVKSEPKVIDILLSDFDTATYTGNE